MTRIMRAFVQISLVLCGALFVSLSIGKWVLGISNTYSYAYIIWSDGGGMFNYCGCYSTMYFTKMWAGLGLTIVQGFVESHGGQVWAENYDHGVGFRFTLQRAQFTYFSDLGVTNG